MKTVTRMIDGRPLPLLVSAVIPGEFRHGFTTRAGGESQPPYHHFNVGMSRGDQPDQVLANRHRLQQWLGVDRLYLVRQVHGAVVAPVMAGQPVDQLAAIDADGLHTDAAGAALGVFVADCVPVLLADPRTGACAAVHAGWRGVVAGAVGAAVRALGAHHGSRPVDLRVALGPCIGRCCFEVGPEVAAAFTAARLPAGGDGVIQVVAGGRAGHPHIDLRQALALQLADLGIPTAQIDAGAECTRCDPDGRFYSYRRDNGRTGAHLGVIVRA